MTELEIALKFDPKDIDILFDKCLCLKKTDCQNDQIKTAVSLKLFIDIAPKDDRIIPESYYSIGACYFLASKDVKMAKNFLKKV